MKKAEPETSTDIDSKAPYPNAEPGIDLDAVSDAWWITFKVHWIFFSSCFSFLALYNSYRLWMTLRTNTKLGRVNYTAIVQMLVIVFGVTRTLALCISPYDLVSNTPERVPYVIPRLLFAIGYPCIFSGFTLVHKIFLQISKVQILKRNFLGSKLVAVVLIVHFVAVILVELVTKYAKNAQFLLVICAFYYLIGCSGVAVSLFISGRRVVGRTNEIRENLNAFASSHNHAPRRASAKTEAQTNKVYKITILTATSGLFCALSYIYTVVLMIRAVSGDDVRPEPWSWLAINTFSRLFELCLASTMSYAVISKHQRNKTSQPSRVNEKLTATSVA